MFLVGCTALKRLVAGVFFILGSATVWCSTILILLGWCLNLNLGQNKYIYIFKYEAKRYIYNQCHIMVLLQIWNFKGWHILTWFGLHRCAWEGKCES